ncbi:MAG: sulfite exporter TauE/SafE family protein [Candidatus Woesearchaeota archaeon]
MAIVTNEFFAEGTTCGSCKKIIEKQASKVQGVKHVTFNLETEEGTVTFDDSKTDIDEILSKIEERGYTCSIIDDDADNGITKDITYRKHNKSDSHYTLNKRTLGWVMGAIGLLVVAYFIFNLIESVQLPQISQNMGYGLLFVVGLFTGFHCISMCGGFVVSYTTKAAQEGKTSHAQHLMYGIGKTASYTIIGALFGLLGSIIAFTPMMRGVAGVLAGLFLLLFGLKMLNIFPVLRRIQFRTPAFIGRFVGKESKKHSSPLMIGLLNGLMIACGPLQAIYIMAAGTGSMIEGAKLLFVFALGTLPVMLGFGVLTSMISKTATHKILKASGAIVIILGLIMINRGLALTGTGFDLNSMVSSVGAAGTSGSGLTKGNADSNAVLLNGGYQEIRMDVTRYGWEPDKFVLKKGIPVRWIINGKEINGCNNAIQVPKMGLKFDIKKGEQVIEFTPEEEGVIPWSCWMGMITGTFIVTDDGDASSPEVQKTIAKAPAPSPTGGSCGGSGGGCGCDR